MSLLPSGQNKNLWLRASDSTRMLSLNNLKLIGRHGMIKQIIMLNAAVYGGYLVMNGPQGQLFKKHFTLAGGSSITSLPFCHLAHTNPIELAVNSLAMFTLGNLHAKKYGCGHFCKVMGVSIAAASVLGAIHVY